MKYKGRKISGPNVEWVVIPRPDGDIAFKATAVLDASRFDKLCPEPKPPKITLPSGVQKDDFKDEHYIWERGEYAKKRYAFLFLETYRNSPHLEWETIDYDNPDTWNNYEQELREAGFTTTEVQLLLVGMGNANSLNQTRIDEARSRFLLELSQEEELISLTAGRHSTQNGEPVSVSESALQT